MNDVPTLIDASWMVRGLGYGAVLGTALEQWLPQPAVVFAGVLIVVVGQCLAARAFSRSARTAA